MGAYSQVRLEVSSHLRGYLGAKIEVGWDCTIQCEWERTRERTRKCTCERLRGVLGSVLGVYLGAS